MELFIRPELQPATDLRKRLNYEERDDQLVGTIAAFAALSELENRLLVRHYVAPSPAEVKAYEEDRYPAWLKE